MGLWVIPNPLARLWELKLLLPLKPKPAIPGMPLIPIFKSLFLRPPIILERLSDEAAPPISVSRSMAAVFIEAASELTMLRELLLCRLAAADADAEVVGAAMLVDPVPEDAEAFDGAGAMVTTPLPVLPPPTLPELP